MGPPASGSVIGEEERAFYQQRVALLGLFGGAIGLAFWLLRSAIGVIYGALDQVFALDYLLHALGWAFLIVVWLLCRSGVRSVRFIRVTEAVGLVGSCIAYIIMGELVTPAARPDLVVILALTFALVARALWVPSSGQRTFVIGTAIGIPLIISIFINLRALPQDMANLIAGEPTDAATVGTILAVFSAAWWAATILLTTAASTTLYGLREEARNVRRLGQYILDEKLGEGGMGVVYRARHAMLRRPTAIKLLRHEGGAAHIERFEREVRQTARLTHPNTVTVYDYGRTPEGIFYYAMELLDGINLQDLVELDGAQPSSRAIRFLVGAAGSLAEAHTAGLVHRDVKPANIFACERGGEYDVPKLLDFGLVKDIRPDASSTLPNAEMLTGTPHYMAPEAITDPDEVDGRSDIYSLGAVGYFLITGSPVFSGKNLVEVCGHHLHTTPEPPSNRLDVPIARGLEELLLRCLAKEPGARPASAAEVRDALLECEGALDWTSADGKAWWDVNRAAIAAKRKHVTALRTVAVDVNRRGTAS